MLGIRKDLVEEKAKIELKGEGVMARSVGRRNKIWTVTDVYAEKRVKKFFRNWSIAWKTSNKEKAL